MIDENDQQKRKYCTLIMEMQQTIALMTAKIKTLEDSIATLSCAKEADKS
jgi:prefoldin subunit 5